VIHPNPGEFGAKIPLHVGDELSRESPEIGHFGSIIGAPNEPKMVSVIPAMLRSSARSVSRANMRAFAGPGYTIAFEVANVG
jgi:hypothetical protein